MIYSAGDNQPHRVMVISRPTRLVIQAIAPNAFRLGKKFEELLTQVGNASDGINIDPAQIPGGVWSEWWSGEVWLVSAKNAQCIIMLPLIHEEILLG